MLSLKKIGIYIEMTRPYNLFVPAAVGFSGAILAYGGFPAIDRLLVATFFPVLLWAAGQIVNDYLNLEEDLVGKPYLPIPSGRIDKYQALIISIAVFSIVIIGTAYYSLIGAAIVGIIIVGTTFYSSSFKKRGIYGNILFGTMVALCLVIGALISTGRVNELIYIVFITIVINHSSQNLIGTLKDIEIDSKNHAKTIIQIRGFHIFVLYAMAISTLALILSLTPWILGYLNETYILIPICSYLFQMRALALFNQSPTVRNGFEALKMYRTATIPLYISFTAGLPGFSVFIAGISALLFTGFAEVLQELLTEEPVTKDAWVTKNV